MIQIAVTRPESAMELRAIARASKLHWGYDNSYMGAWTLDDTITEVLLRDSPTYCAFQNNEIAGFYIFAREGDPRTLKHFWVNPNFIGTGVGKKLLTHAIQLLQQLGVKKLSVSAEPHAQGFYSRMGAVHVGKEWMPHLNQEFPLMEITVEDKMA